MNYNETRKPGNCRCSDTHHRFARSPGRRSLSGGGLPAGCRHTIGDLDQSAAELALSNGDEKLTDLPDVGKSIARVVAEYVNTGRSGLLERLEGQVSPEDLFTTVPGISGKLAHRIHRQLDIDTLEDLELAAFDGRLQTVTGIGYRRARAIRDSVAAILNRSGRRRALSARPL